MRKTIETGTPIPADMRTRIVGRYADRLLQLRGEVLALNETFVSLAGAKHEAFRQAIASGKIEAQAVTKTWRHFPSEHPRMQHISMAGKSAQFDQPFIMPDGTALRWPHDPEAPVRHTLGCKCQVDYSVDLLAGLR